MKSRGMFFFLVFEALLRLLRANIIGVSNLECNITVAEMRDESLSCYFASAGGVC
jgi:hypothetical protein